MLAAIEALIRECEDNPLAAPNVDRVADARCELEAYRRTSRLLRRLNAKRRERERRAGHDGH